ncbi:MAG: porin, partial [Paracoccus sp. (in: a-proteobacteria)]|nr:porin [Paracoccus sp. (in: a-proteobacteria)]
ATYDTDGNYVSGGESSWNVVNRMRVHFTMTGESQSGISFGAKLRSDQHSNSGGNRSATAGTVWVSSAYGKLTVGDIDGALEKAVGDLPEVGLTGLDFWNEFAYIGSEEGAYGDAGVLYEYGIGNAHLYLSFHDRYAANTDVKHDTAAWSVGVGYDLGGYTFGIGYDRSPFTFNPFTVHETSSSIWAPVGPLGWGEKSSTWGISGGTSIQGITFKAAYLKTNSDDDNLDYAQYGLGAAYDMANGVGLSGYYRKNDFKNIEAKGHAIGLGASYDLGGGATVKGGVVYTKSTILGDERKNTLADFGLEFKF